MPVIIQDFEAVQEEGPTAGADTGGPRRRPGPVAMASLDRLLVVHRARRMRLWAN
jgi:hypothetical protein